MNNLINQPWYLLVKDILTFLFTGAGLIIASMGLATWKKQMKGTKEFDAAYNLNYAVLKLRDAIKYVRNPAIWPSESRQAIQYLKSKYPGKSDEELERDCHAAVYEMRWEKITTASTEMESYLLAAEILWKQDILNLIKPLNTKVNELNIAIRKNFQPELKSGDFITIHNVIYDKGDGSKDEDAFSQEVNKAIGEIADYLQSKMS
jgi:hypothetical protein